MPAQRRGVNVRVLSNSWGGSGFSQALLDAINKAWAEGIFVSGPAARWHWPPFPAVKAFPRSFVGSLLVPGRDRLSCRRPAASTQCSTQCTQFVAAAGNAGSTALMYPAAYGSKYGARGVIAVGSIGSSGAPSSFTNRGECRALPHWAGRERSEACCEWTQSLTACVSTAHLSPLPCRQLGAPGGAGREHLVDLAGRKV